MARIALVAGFVAALCIAPITTSPARVVFAPLQGAEGGKLQVDVKKFDHAATCPTKCKPCGEAMAKALDWLPHKQEEGQEHAAEGQNGHPRSAGERGDEGAGQRRHDRRSAAELSDQVLETPHEPSRSAAFREEVTGEREQGDAGKRVTDREGVMLQRHRGDGLTAGPEQDQRGTSERGEHGRAAHHGGKQRGQGRPAKFVHLDRRIQGGGHPNQRQRQRRGTPAPVVHGAPH